MSAHRGGPLVPSAPGVHTTAPGVEQLVHVPGQRAVPTAAQSTELTRELGAMARAGGLADAATRSARGTRAAAGRWPNGKGPITHGSSNTMTGRCRAENGGRACDTCRAGDAARQREWQARRAQRGSS